MDDLSEWDRRIVEEFKEKSEAMERLEAEVAGMKKNEALTQKRIIMEFKSSKDYQEESKKCCFQILW